MWIPPESVFGFLFMIQAFTVSSLTLSLYMNFWFIATGKISKRQVQTVESAANLREKG
jgi:hypothetical protein